jgi:hypothetical protein
MTRLIPSAGARSRPKPDAMPAGFRVVAWERLAETCAEYLTKGARVFVVMWTKRVYCHLAALVKAHGRAPDRCWFSW